MQIIHMKPRAKPSKFLKKIFFFFKKVVYLFLNSFFYIEKKNVFIY